jgi:hypothetical protein
MRTVNIDNLVEQIRKCVERHKIADGKYSRWLWQNEKGDRELGCNPYGCADAANILYSISQFPRDAKERCAFVDTLRSMQEKSSGMFHEKTHHTIHTTAHCLAALELFDASPLYPCTQLLPLLQKEKLYDFLENEVNWLDPWPQSHKGAGIFVALTMTDAVDLEWKNNYFSWLWEHSDIETGFFHHGEERTKMPASHMMAGGFHYFFNHEAERRPYRYPEKVIDSCIGFMREYERYGMIKRCTFIDIDVIFCLNRAMRQTPYRFEEAKEELEKYAEKYVDFMNGIDYENDEDFNDLHMLFGAVCCLAELQMALPGKILTSKPLRLVLDRRPFI